MAELGPHPGHLTPEDGWLPILESLLGTHHPWFSRLLAVVKSAHVSLTVPFDLTVDFLFLGR